MSKSSDLFAKAQRTIPGGVNSPVRAFAGVGGTPLFIERADGAYIFDADGKAYIDYVGSWGPMILGHNHTAIRDAVIEAARNGLSFGAPTEMEITMAEMVSRLVPSMEMVRMVSSGTEATMSAIRLARGFTGRDKIIKFEGCYHGHADCLLVKAGSGALTLGQPSSPGVPEDFAKHTLTCTYNNLESVREAFASHPDQIACIIVEPVAGNMNCIPPVAGFLEGLREICDEFGALLTVGAFGGRREVMEYIAPTGPVYQAGTLSGNPVAMAAGHACLTVLTEEGNEARLANTTKRLAEGFKAAADKHGIPLLVHQVGGMFGFFFTDQEQVTCYEEVAKCDVERFKHFFHLMLDKGVYLAPSAFEASFTSLAHNSREIDATLEAAELSFAELAKMA